MNSNHYNIELINRKVVGRLVPRGHIRWELKINGDDCEYIQFINNGEKDFFKKYPNFVFNWSENENYKLVDLETQIKNFIKSWKVKQDVNPSTAKTFEKLIDEL
jgi:hypothetical protein